MAPAEGAIPLALLSERIRQTAATAVDRQQTGTLRQGIAVVEREMIAAAYAQLDGNKSRVAKHLEISRWTLQQKLKEYGIT
jgi:transcriptional regulator with PAS, ATPase and Fis domain